MASVIQVGQVDYPESDGKPMGETDKHRLEMIRHTEILGEYYRGQTVYVSGNLLLYYVRGNPDRYVVPDAFVVKGLAPGDRRTYKVWIEGKVPNIVIETTSRKTRRNDTVTKPSLYASLGIPEYFLFDPEGAYLDPPLQGYRLAGKAYRRITADSAGCLESKELGLKLCGEEGQLEFFRMDTGQRLLAPAERAEREAQRADREAKARRREAQARRREAQARQAAEAELAKLRQQLSRRTPG